jgi:hypothetical protein
MSKKKKKFKKKISQSLHERIARIETEQSRPAGDQPKAEVVSRRTEDQIRKEPKKEVEATVETDKYAYVKHDVRRDLLVIFILIFILAAVTVVNQKTDYLRQVADWIYSTLNLKV